MAKFLLTICLIIASTVVIYAQTYFPFPTSDASWSGKLTWYDMPTSYPSFHVMKWEGDTIINATSYKKVYDGLTYLGGIRHDLPNKKTFYLGRDTVEYAFPQVYNKNIGDTIVYSCKINTLLQYFYNGELEEICESPYYDDYWYVYGDARVDSVVVTDIVPFTVAGEERRKYSFQSIHQTTAPNLSSAEYVLGLGFVWFRGFEKQYDIKCHFFDGAYALDDLGYNYYCVVGNSDIEGEIEVNISPNPGINSINVKTESSLYDIEIIDNTGKSVMRSYSNSNTAQLDVSSLKNGVYIVTVISNEGRITREKWVKM